MDAIRAHARRETVILLQADHGHGHVPREAPPLAEMTAAMVHGRASVFAAYLLPGVAPDSVPPGITPINAVRLVLRQYFHAQLPALPDATFWSSSTTPYRFELIPTSGLAPAAEQGAGKQSP